MKYIKNVLVLLISLIWFLGVTCNASGTTTSDAITVKVTEKIPWAGCTLDTESSKWDSKIYKCTIQPWFTTVQIMIGQIVKWFTAIAALAWVLFIVINGIMLSMNGGEKEKIKGRITQSITWLILLLLSWLILSIIAPWVYK